MAAIDRAVAGPVQFPARLALCARRPGRPRRSLRTRGSRHALLTLPPRRGLRPDPALIALPPLCSLLARAARGARRAVRAPRGPLTRGPPRPPRPPALQPLGPPV